MARATGHKGPAGKMPPMKKAAPKPAALKGVAAPAGGPKKVPAKPVKAGGKAAAGKFMGGR